MLRLSELQACDLSTGFPQPPPGVGIPCHFPEGDCAEGWLRTRVFVHLHVHSEFSLLDGASRIREMFSRAAEHGMPALAVTDHGAMYGALDFYNAGVAAGVKPIVGVEAYVAPRSRFDRNRQEGEEAYRHLTVLAKNETGYRNLMKLVTAGWLEGYFGAGVFARPRIDKEILAEHAEGLIVLSGCLAGETAKMIVSGRMDAAERAAAEYRDIVGAGELLPRGHGARHRGAANREPRAGRALEEAGHPARRDERHALHRQGPRHRPRRPAVHPAAEGPDGHAPAEVRHRGVLPEVARPRCGRSSPRCPEACDNTLRIAEMCDLKLTFGDYHLPQFEPPDGETLESHLRRLVAEGAARRYGDPLPPEVRDRLDHELSIICSMGFAGYFLVVWDLIRFAKSARHPGRPGPRLGGRLGRVVLACRSPTSTRCATA